MVPRGQRRRHGDSSAGAAEGAARTATGSSALRRLGEMRAASMRGRVTHLPEEGDRATKPPPRSAFVPKQETRASFPGGAHRPQHRSRSCLPWRPPCPAHGHLTLPPRVKTGIRAFLNACVSLSPLSSSQELFLAKHLGRGGGASRPPRERGGRRSSGPRSSVALPLAAP